MAERRVAVRFTLDATRINAAMRRAIAALARIDLPSMRQAVAQSHRSRPAPLCIEGHAYRRRRRARARRR